MNRTLLTAVVFFSIFSLLMGMFAFFEIQNFSYDDLVGVPVVDYTGFANVTDIPQSFPYANLTGVPSVDYAGFANVSDIPDVSGFGSYDNLTGVPVIDLSHGLVMHYSLDNVVLDSSGYRSDGSLSGAVYADVMCAEGLYFDGVNDNVVCSNTAVMGVDYITISFWAKRSGAGTGTAPRFVNCGMEYCVYIMGNSVYWYIRDESVTSKYNIYAARSVQDVLCHYTLTWDGSDLEMYINGTWVAPTSRNGAGSGKIQKAGNNFVLGAYYTLSTHFFNGYLDDVRVYNRVLSGYEISALYGLGV